MFSRTPVIATILISLLCFLLTTAETSKKTEREVFLSNLKCHLHLTEDAFQKVKAIFASSRFIGQGNPSVTKHPITRETCQGKLKAQHIHYQNPKYEQICKAPYMAPLYNPKTEKAEQSTVCIDQFEFPNIPCEYPIIWVRAREAEELCRAIGKRLCDTHEWEGACAGELRKPDYPFHLVKQSASDSTNQQIMRKAHNKSRQIVWSYGHKQNHALCGTNSTKSDGCNRSLSSGKGVWETCGSNTYPVGVFPECKSPLDVYDLHGNAAEHMNLPFNQSQMTFNGGTGYTEMKGSWFIFAKYSAHQDDCRWRAPYWHGSKIMSPHSHRNYHLGFRCCKTITKR